MQLGPNTPPLLCYRTQSPVANHPPLGAAEALSGDNTLQMVVVMNRGGGTQNPKTRDCGKLMSPCHTLESHDVTCDKSHDMSHW
jgi:hypothetical protein